MAEKRRQSDTSHKRAMAEDGPYLALGLELSLTMIVWIVIGYLLDRWLETAPWLTMIGALIGMIGVFVRIARVGRSTARKSEQEK